MFELPAELQMMTIENITDLDSLVALYDSLPSNAQAAHRFLLHTIFNNLHLRHTKDIETLQQCRDAVFEIRDCLGIEKLLPKFQALEHELNLEIHELERPIEFRGLTHPDQSQTILKKVNMRERHTLGSPKLQTRRQQENAASLDDPCPSLICETTQMETVKTRPMWRKSDGEICLQHFLDNLYAGQLDT